MKFKVETKQLKNALSKIITITDKKTFGQLSGLSLISAEKDQIKITSFDNELFGQVSIPAINDEETEFCINAKNLFDIVKELDSEVLDFDLNQESNTINLHSIKSFYSLLIYPTTEFPRFHLPTNLEEISITPQNITEMITYTNHAVSNDDTRIYLNGIFFQVVNNSIRAVATDGHRLSMLESSFEGDNSDIFETGIIIPKKGISEIKRMADDPETEKIYLKVNESFLYVSNHKNYNLSIRLISRDYPKYQAVIPNNIISKVKTDRNSIFEAVKRIRIMASDKSNQIRLNIFENKLELSANHPSLGNAKEVVDVAYDGKDFEIGFNAKYLVDSLGALTDGDISLELTNEMSPVVIKSNSNPNYLGIIMPLKL